MSDSILIQSEIESFGVRVRRKIHSIGYRKDLLCYLIIEELLLLLDVPVIFVSVTRRNEAGDSVDADTNITEFELRSLHNVDLSGSHEVAPGVVVTELAVVGLEKISGLKGLAQKICISVSDFGNSNSVSMIVAFWNGPEGNQRGSTVATALLDGELSWHFLLAELQTILQQESRSKFGDEFSASDESDSNDGNPGFLTQKRNFFSGLKESPISDITDRYRERFLPLVSIVDRIHEACRFLVAPATSTREQSEYLFSYREPSEDCISFLLSTEQLSWLGEKDRDGLFNLTQSRFVKIRVAKDELTGLSGYLLSTGHSRFSPDPVADLSWRDTEQVGWFHRVVGQLQNRFSGLESNQENTFLMPLCVRRMKRQLRTLPAIARSANVGEYRVPRTNLLFFVECRLPQNKDEQLRIRRNLFDLAWEFMPAIEASIVAQRATEQVVRADENRNTDLGRWAALVHDLPKQIVTPTETATKNIKRQFGLLCREVPSIPAIRRDQIEREIDIAIMMTRHAASLMRFATPKLGRDEVQRNDKETVELATFCREFAGTMSTFVESRVEARFGDGTYNPVSESELVEPSIAKFIGIKCQFSEGLPRRFKYCAHLVYSLIRNHVENSFEELIYHCRSLMLANPSRGLITIEISPLPDIANALKIRIADQGRGLPDEIRNGKQASINRTLSGIFPDLIELQGRRSDKPGNMGLGLFNSAAMLYAMNRDDGFTSSSGNLELLSRNDGLHGLVVDVTFPIQIV